MVGQPFVLPLLFSCFWHETLFEEKGDRVAFLRFEQEGAQSDATHDEIEHLRLKGGDCEEAEEVLLEEQK